MLRDDLEERVKKVMLLVKDDVVPPLTFPDFREALLAIRNAINRDTAPGIITLLKKKNLAHINLNIGMVIAFSTSPDLMKLYFTIIDELLINSESVEGVRSILSERSNDSGWLLSKIIGHYQMDDDVIQRFFYMVQELMVNGLSASLACDEILTQKSLDNIFIEIFSKQSLVAVKHAFDFVDVLIDNDVTPEQIKKLLSHNLNEKQAEKAAEYLAKHIDVLYRYLKLELLPDLFFKPLRDTKEQLYAYMLKQTEDEQLNTCNLVLTPGTSFHTLIGQRRKFWSGINESCNSFSLFETRRKELLAKKVAPIPTLKLELPEQPITSTPPLNYSMYPKRINGEWVMPSFNLEVQPPPTFCTIETSAMMPIPVQQYQPEKEAKLIDFDAPAEMTKPQFKTEDYLALLLAPPPPKEPLQVLPLPPNVSPKLRQFGILNASSSASTREQPDYLNTRIAKLA